MIYRLHREGVFYLLYALLGFVLTLVLFIFFMSWITGLLLGVATFFLVLFLIFFRDPPAKNEA